MHVFSLVHAALILCDCQLQGRRVDRLASVGACQASKPQVGAVKPQPPLWNAANPALAALIAKPITLPYSMRNTNTPSLCCMHSDTGWITVNGQADDEQSLFALSLYIHTCCLGQG